MFCNLVGMVVRGCTPNPQGLDCELGRVNFPPTSFQSSTGKKTSRSCTRRLPRGWRGKSEHLPGRNMFETL
eukprot:1312540-Pyramimonas_sp.AAC.1